MFWNWKEITIEKTLKLMNRLFHYDSENQFTHWGLVMKII